MRTTSLLLTALLTLAAAPAAHAACADDVRAATDEVATGAGLASHAVRDLEASCGSDGVARVVEALIDRGYCADAAQLGRSLGGRTGVAAAVDRADECLAEQVLSSLDDLDLAAGADLVEAEASPIGEERWSNGPADSNDEDNRYGALGRLGDLSSRGSGTGAGGSVSGGYYGDGAARADAPRSAPRAATKSKRRYRGAEQAATGVGAYEPSPDDDRLAAATGSGPRIAAGADVAWSSLSFRVWFDFDSAALRPEALATIEALAQHLDSMGRGSVLEIIGHTDSRGSGWYNDDLSVRRARSVQWALERGAADSASLSVRGMGEYAPAYSNSSEWGRARNRRVEFRFYRPVASRQVTH